jgi:hypothetical protein
MQEKISSPLPERYVSRLQGLHDTQGCMWLLLIGETGHFYCAICGKRAICPKCIPGKVKFGNNIELISCTLHKWLAKL